MQDKRWLKAISLIAIPIAVLLIHLIIKWIGKVEIKGIGISLATIGLSQIFPFVLFENLIMGKFISLKKEDSLKKNVWTRKTTPLINENIKEIDSVRNKFILIFIANLLLFLITIGLFSYGFELSHIISGFLSCILSWQIIVFS